MNLSLHTDPPNDFPRDALLCQGPNISEPRWDQGCQRRTTASL